MQTWSVRRTGACGLRHEKKIRVNAVQIMGKCNRGGKIEESCARTHYNFQDRPYPPPAIFRPEIEESEKLSRRTLEGQPPPLAPPFPALLHTNWENMLMLWQEKKRTSLCSRGNRVNFLIREFKPPLKVSFRIWVLSVILRVSWQPSCSLVVSSWIFKTMVLQTLATFRYCHNYLPSNMIQEASEI